MANPYQYSGNGQGFLTDYSNLAGIGSAVQSFADSYQKAKNNQLSNQEQQAQIEALKARTQREGFQQKLETYKAGDQVDDQGNISPRQMTDRESTAQNFGYAEKGLMPDPNKPGQFIMNPNTPAAKSAINSGLRGQAAMLNFGKGQDAQSYAAVRHIHDDKTLVGMRGQAANIDKGMETLNGSADHKPSWLEVNEVAQDYANALSGAKGSSDFKLKQSEQESFDKYLGDLAGKIKSNPDQPADQTYVDFYKKFGSRLASTYDKQMGARANNLLVGSQQAFKHNPNAFESAKEAAGLYQNGMWRNAPDIQGAQQQAPQSQSQPQAQSQGLVPKQQGFLSGLLSPLMGSSAQAAPPVQQDPDAVKYAQMHQMDYATAANIVAKRKAQMNGR